MCTVILKLALLNRYRTVNFTVTVKKRYLTVRAPLIYLYFNGNGKINGALTVK